MAQNDFRYLSPNSDTARLIHKKCGCIVCVDIVKLTYGFDKNGDISEKFWCTTHCPECDKHIRLNTRNFKVY